MSLIPGKTTVRSYDFWGNDRCYAEGVFSGYGNPHPLGNPDEFIIIRVTKRVLDGMETDEVGHDIYTPRPEVREDAFMMPELTVLA